MSKLLAQTLYYTGLRISECLKLRLQDVELDNGIIHVRFAKAARYRALPINEKLKILLEQYINNSRADVGVDLLFVTYLGKFSTRHFGRWLRKAEADSGIGKHVTAHVLRHSFATNLIKKGVEVPKVQRLLGHRSVETTTIYIHSDMRSLKNAVDLL